MSEIDNTQDIIDSREIIERIDELQCELDILKSLEEEASTSPDWSHGEPLIHENYFVDYCKELCEDIGYISDNLPWYIANHIDWDGVAEELEEDYIKLDFDGETYFIRA